MSSDYSSSFRTRMMKQDRLIGSFLKIGSTMPAEILGTLGFDFAVIDLEHSALTTESCDQILLACRAHGIGGLVRVRSAEASGILTALDSGADGVLVPHIDSAEKAREAVAAARYRNGRRGYAATTRAGRFGGNSMVDHIAEQDSNAAVIAMIEDPPALDRLDEIFTVEGLDAAFIGRGDLTAAMGEQSAKSPRVRAAAEQIAARARAHGKIVCAMASSTDDAAALADMGATVMITASDQTYLRRAAQSDLAAIKNAINSN